MMLNLVHHHHEFNCSCAMIQSMYIILCLA